MPNREIINRLLKPKQTGNPEVDLHNAQKWEEFLNTVDDKISWYPSAASDFRDVVFLNNTEFNITELYPSVYIHTDLNLPYDMILNQRVENEIGVQVNINDIIELNLNIN